jgi:hypothetical protein
MTIPGTILDRMRANLAAAGITLSDADLDAISTSPFLKVAADLDERNRSSSGDAVPDYVCAPPMPDAPTPVGPGHRVGTSEDHASYDSILATATRLRAGTLSPVYLVEQALRRIEERDPILNAFHHALTEPALDAARRAEREIAAGEYRGPLHGIPIAVKDLIAQRGIETGQIDSAEPHLTTLAVFGMCNWAYQWYRPTGSHRPRDIAAHFWRMIVDDTSSPAPTASTKAMADPST